MPPAEGRSYLPNLARTHPRPHYTRAARSTTRSPRGQSMRVTSELRCVSNHPRESPVRHMFFFQQFVQANIKQIIEHLHNLPLGRGNGSPLDSPYKGQVMRKSFPRHQWVSYFTCFRNYWHMLFSSGVCPLLWIMPFTKHFCLILICNAIHVVNCYVL